MKPKNRSGGEELLASRTYLWRPPTGKPRDVVVAIGRPKAGERSWSCPLRITGLPKTIDEQAQGVDAVQALELALFRAGHVLARTPEFRAGQIRWEGQPVRDPLELGLPLYPLRLQHAFDLLRRSQRQLRERKGSVRDEYRRSMMALMREVAGDLATLVARFAVRKRKIDFSD
jgi:hypothetical protein